MFDTKGVKSEEIQDPRTGEKIIRKNVTPEQAGTVQKVIAEHSQYSNEFMMISQNLVVMQKRQAELHALMAKTDSSIKIAVKDIVTQLGLKTNDSWGWNIPMACLERREAPKVGPLQEPTNEEPIIK